MEAALEEFGWICLAWILCALVLVAFVRWLCRGID